VPKEKIEELRDYHTSPRFSGTEKLVLQLADAMTQTPAEIPDDLFDQLRQRLNEAQLVELATAIAWENYRARFNHTFGAESENFSQGSVCALPVHAQGSR
jgi:alkylhydroperoxidase family enzyme